MTKTKSLLSAYARVYGPDGELRPNVGLGWKYTEWGDEGRLARNRVARELRRVGYEVKVQTTSFSDLARDHVYTLEAHIPGTPKPAFGIGIEWQHPEQGAA